MLLMRLTNWFASRLTGESKKPASIDFKQINVQPCVIKGKPFIVYPRGLQQQAPDLYQQLSQHYTAQGYTLKEDQRSKRDDKHHQHERRRWTPIVIFTASLLFETNAHADVELDYQNEVTPPQHQVSLHMVPNDDIRNKISKQLTTPGNQNKVTNIQFKSNLANELFNILSDHYTKNTTDPDYIVDDFKAMANYYSEFPEVVTMLKKLDKKKWQLTFDEDNWVTVASGNVFQVNSAVVHFNTRTAAQLRLNNKCKQNPICIASPADALLHELLHTYSMLINSEKFISQGGMNSVMYPYKHEYAVIDKERKLYALMTRQDKIKRPQRSDHTGRVVRVNCPTCIK